MIDLGQLGLEHYDRDEIEVGVRVAWWFRPPLLPAGLYRAVFVIDPVVSAGFPR